MTSAEFKQAYGVAYTPRLILPSPLRESFRTQCERYGARTAGDIEPGLRARILRKLGEPAPIPGRVAWIDASVGRGLFAARALSPGDVVGEYAGVLSTDWRPLAEGGRFNPYLLRYPFDTPFAVDAETAGNELRFINHSSTRSNVGRRHVLCDDAVRVAFVAEEMIPAGAQFLVDYGPAYWQGHPPAELADRERRSMRRVAG